MEVKWKIQKKDQNIKINGWENYEKSIKIWIIGSQKLDAKMFENI